MYFLEESFLPNFFIRRFSSVSSYPSCFSLFRFVPRSVFSFRLVSLLPSRVLFSRFVSFPFFRPAAPFPRFVSFPVFRPAAPFPRFGSFPRSRPAFIFRLRLIPVPPPYSHPHLTFRRYSFGRHFSRRSSSDVTNPQCKSFS